jgi:hypothetical protein
MTEVLQELNRIVDELGKKTQTVNEYLSKEEISVGEHIKTLEEIRTNNAADPNIRMLAAIAVVSEHSNKIQVINQTITLNYLTQLSITVKILANNINSELLQLKQIAPLKTADEDKKEIVNLKEQLVEIQKSTNEMQPYVEMLRIGIEKKNKWLKDNV